MSKHTPGPWPILEGGDFKRIIVGPGLVEGPNGYDVAEIYSDDCDYDEARANARLIAAAPDLYDALKLLHAHLFGPEPAQPRHVLDDMCRAAIAKAEGREP